MCFVSPLKSGGRWLLTRGDWSWRREKGLYRGVLTVEAGCSDCVPSSLSHNDLGSGTSFQTPQQELLSLPKTDIYNIESHKNIESHPAPLVLFCYPYA